MKYSKIILIPVVLVLTIAMIFSCRTTKQNENTPQAVAVRFMKYMGQFEFEKARELGTEKTGRMVDMLEMLMDLSKEKGQDTLLKKKDINIEVLNVAIDGNVAVVKYRNEAGKEQSLDMLKVKGKWLVDMKKETPNINDLPKNFKIDNKRPTPK